MRLAPVEVTVVEAYWHCRVSATKAEGTEESLFLGVISESDETVTPRYRPSWCQSWVKAFCPAPVSPRRTEKRPLVTVTETAVGDPTVPAAVQMGVPPVAPVYRENLREYAPSATADPLEVRSLPW
jgi:hypothetical protein